MSSKHNWVMNTKKGSYEFCNATFDEVETFALWLVESGRSEVYDPVTMFVDGKKLTSRAEALMM